LHDLRRQDPNCGGFDPVTTATVLLSSGVVFLVEVFQGQTSKARRMTASKARSASSQRVKIMGPDPKPTR
jgi:hypothetical protein